MLANHISPALIAASSLAANLGEQFLESPCQPPEAPIRRVTCSSFGPLVLGNCPPNWMHQHPCCHLGQLAFRFAVFQPGSNPNPNANAKNVHKNYRPSCCNCQSKRTLACSFHFSGRYTQRKKLTTYTA